MPYYVLKRSGGALYSMNMLLSAEQARRYGKAEETVPVQALYIWTNLEELQVFQLFLAVEQQKQHSLFSGLIKDMRADRVDILELSADQTRDRLRKYRRVPFVCINPGPNQTIRRVDEFLVQLEG